MSSTRIMYIFRGLPGSGKSTAANAVVGALRNEHAVCSYCSADNYFVRPDGTYDWNPKLLSKAHMWCYDQARKGAEVGFPIVIDNTNIKRSEFQKYLDLAKTYRYEVREQIIGEFDEASCQVYAARNIHGCPLDVILKRAKDFQR